MGLCFDVLVFGYDVLFEKLVCLVEEDLEWLFRVEVVLGG